MATKIIPLPPSSSPADKGKENEKFLDLSNFVTPPTSPKSGETTPLSRMKQLALETTPDRSLLGDELEVLEKGYDRLAELSTVERQKEIAGITDSVTSRAYFQKPSNTQKDLFGVKDDLQEAWLVEFLDRLNKLYSSKKQSSPRYPLIRLVNFEHILGPVQKKTKNIGFHFCPENHPLRSKIDGIVTNPYTGVWCGTYESKFSTFFPNEIKDEQQLLTVLAEGKTIAQNKNRALIQVRTEQHKFLVEEYKHKQGFIIHTVFPIFYYAQYENDATYTITDSLKLDSKQVLERAKSLKDSFQYDTGDHLIIDIASALDSPIKRGILISIPKTLL